MAQETNTKEQYLLHLLSCALKGRKPDEKPDEISWEEIFKFAIMHNVANIACNGIERLFRKPDDDLWRRWKEVRNKAGIDDVTFKAEQRKACILLSEEGIRCLPLNGKWIKDQYPGTDMRVMSVLDILIDEENEEKVRDILVVDGFICEQHGTGLYDLYRKQPIIDVEVYRALATEKTEAVCGSYEECFSYASPIPGRPYVYEMPIEEAYVYYMANLHRQYSSGIGIQPIMDIYLIRKNHRDSWDEEIIRKLLSEIKLQDFEQEMHELAEYWFGDGPATKWCLQNEKRIFDMHRSNVYTVDAPGVPNARVKAPFSLSRIFKVWR